MNGRNKIATATRPLWRSRTDGTVWIEVERVFHFNHAIGVAMDHVTLAARDGMVLRLTMTDEDEWNDLERMH